jgi:hypothetical protein
MSWRLLHPMKAWILIAMGMCAALLAAGCVSKTKHREEVKKAFLAGQSEATMRMVKSFGPSVTIEGEVRQSFVPWTRELTLAKAIIAADYYGAQDPRKITIVRNGEELPVDPARLLTGDDYPVAPGDVIRLK